MIITRTPLRISFFGGGTDYPVWFRQHEGAVISTTINKYIYISTRYLPPFFDHKSRIVWSHIELVKQNNQIKHPAVREVLNFMNINKGVEIHYDADLPARTGLGSSSAFTVGLLHNLYALKGQMVSKKKLAQESIYIEQDMIKENVGCQDQVIASYGGFNLTEFKKDDSFIVSPITLSPEKFDQFKKHILLVFTGFTRTASVIAGKVIKNAPKKEKELNTIFQMVQEGIKILSNDKTPITKFGELLHESWLIKRDLAEDVSNSNIDTIYSEARNAGALGGKLLGAGGGGFILLFAPPQAQKKIKEKLKKLLFVPIDFDQMGSQVVFYNPDINKEWK